MLICVVSLFVLLLCMLLLLFTLFLFTSSKTWYLCYLKFSTPAKLLPDMTLSDAEPAPGRDMGTPSPCVGQGTTNDGHGLPCHAGLDQAKSSSSRVPFQKASSEQPSEDPIINVASFSTLVNIALVIVLHTQWLNLGLPKYMVKKRKHGGFVQKSCGVLDYPATNPILIP